MNPIDCDVVIAGGGMAGTVAAIAAARQGAHTLLFERHGFLGGAASLAACGRLILPDQDADWPFASPDQDRDS